MAGILRESRIDWRAAKMPTQKHPGFVGESDNEWNVAYAESVVNVIQQVGEERRSARARRYPTAPSVTLDCETCAHPFVALACDAQRGRIRHCSRSCHSRANARLLHSTRSQAGANNPNWRGGRASRPYESYVRAFKASNPEKARAHRRVAEAVRSGRLIRPETCESCGQPCRAQAHHDDYGQPLKVVWLCRRCHRTADAARREAAR